MRFDVLDKKYIQEASQLAQAEYENASQVYGSLYKLKDIPDFDSLIEGIFDAGQGLVAIEDEKLVGYLAYYAPIKDLFGYVEGAFSPLQGNAFGGKNRAKTASLLFEETSKLLVKQGVLQYGVCLYANDTEMLESFSLNGFGYRCADGILDLQYELEIDKGLNVDFTELKSKEALKIYPLKSALLQHMADGPTYFPVGHESIADFEKALSEQNSRYFCASLSGKPIAYLEVTDEGETFLSNQSDYKHLCGAYLLIEYRGQGILQSLLKFVADTLKEEGVGKLGVDCETLNPSAYNFWRKYFHMYTYSLVRRLDERILINK